MFACFGVDGTGLVAPGGTGTIVVVVDAFDGVCCI